MPIVSESDTPSRIQATVHRNSTTGVVLCKQGRHRSQTGYRSGPLSKAEQRAIEGKIQHLGNVRENIGYLEEVGYQYQARANRPFLVHDRNYTETTYRLPGLFQYSGVFQRSGSSDLPFDVGGLLAVESVNPAAVMPSAPSTSALESMAGDMMRQSVPNPQTFNLYRSLAEQKDARLTLRGLDFSRLYRDALLATQAGATKGDLGRLGKSSIKKSGELFLTWVFGIKPTLGDIQVVADAVIRSDHGVRRTIGSGKTQTRSRRKRILWEDSAYGTQAIKLASGNLQNGTLTLGPTDYKYSYLQYAGSGSSANVLAPVLDWSWSAVRTLHQFATWEFFVPEPHKIESRLDSYKEAAQNLIGSGASASTVYDLSPYTWLVDWFFDVGGLIHYQEALNGNGVVARSSGYSLFDRMTVSATFQKHVYNPIGTLSPYTVKDYRSFGTTAHASYKRHVRRAGNPYSIGPTWSLSSQQWSILGALGISQALS